MSDLVFRKSSYSGGQSADCVEVAVTDAGVAVRDSKAPSEAVLALSAGQWRALIKSHALINVTVLLTQHPNRLRHRQIRGLSCFESRHGRRYWASSRTHFRHCARCGPPSLAMGITCWPGNVGNGGDSACTRVTPATVGQCGYGLP
jgi:hypothetical protein